MPYPPMLKPTNGWPQASLLWLGLVLATLLLMPLPGWTNVGVVTHVSGVLVVERPSGETRILAANSEVHEGDVLTSEAKSFARIRFSDGGNLLVRPSTRIVIERYQFERDKPEQDAVAVNLVKGGLRSITGTVGKRSAERHTTTTPTATVGIRGTHFGLQECQGDCAGLNDNAGQPLRDGLHIDVLAGRIVAFNPAGELEIGLGQFGYVRDRATPPELVAPEQGFYAGIPPNMSAPTGAGITIGLASNDNVCVIR